MILRDSGSLSSPFQFCDLGVELYTQDIVKFLRRHLFQDIFKMAELAPAHCFVEQGVFVISLFTAIGVRAPLDLGGGDLIAGKKVHNARKRVLYKRTQNAVKTKTFTILTSNEPIIIPKLPLNPDFSNLQGKRKLVRKIRYFEKSGVTNLQ